MQSKARIETGDEDAFFCFSRNFLWFARSSTRACTRICMARRPGRDAEEAGISECQHKTGENLYHEVRRSRPSAMITSFSSNWPQDGLPRSANRPDHAAHKRPLGPSHSNTVETLTSMDKDNPKGTGSKLKSRRRFVLGCILAHQHSRVQQRIGTYFSANDPSKDWHLESLVNISPARHKKREMGTCMWWLLVLVTLGEFLVLAMGHPGAALLSVDGPKSHDSVFVPSRLEGVFTLSSRTSPPASPSSRRSKASTDMLASTSPNGKRQRTPLAR